MQILQAHQTTGQTPTQNVTSTALSLAEEGRRNKKNKTKQNTKQGKLQTHPDQQTHIMGNAVIVALSKVRFQVARTDLQRCLLLLVKHQLLQKLQHSSRTPSNQNNFPQISQPAWQVDKKTSTDDKKEFLEKCWVAISSLPDLCRARARCCNAPRRGRVCFAFIVAELFRRKNGLA